HSYNLPYTLSLHDALPILVAPAPRKVVIVVSTQLPFDLHGPIISIINHEHHTKSKITSATRHPPLELHRICGGPPPSRRLCGGGDRKSTRLNSSHLGISYA